MVTMVIRVDWDNIGKSENKRRKGSHSLPSFDTVQVNFTKRMELNTVI